MVCITSTNCATRAQMTHHAAAIYIAGRITAFPPFKGTDKSEREREKKRQD